MIPTPSTEEEKCVGECTDGEGYYCKGIHRPSTPQDEALRREEWDEYKDLTVRDVILIWIGERKSNLDTTILESGMSFLLSSRLAEARESEYQRCLSVLDKDHSKCSLPQTCIGYGNAQSDLMNSAPDLLASLEITNQHEGV